MTAMSGRAPQRLEGMQLWHLPSLAVNTKVSGGSWVNARLTASRQCEELFASSKGLFKHQDKKNNPQPMRSFLVWTHEDVEKSTINANAKSVTST